MSGTWWHPSSGHSIDLWELPDELRQKLNDAVADGTEIGITLEGRPYAVLTGRFSNSDIAHYVTLPLIGQSAAGNGLAQDETTKRVYELVPIGRLDAVVVTPGTPLSAAQKQED